MRQNSNIAVCDLSKRLKNFLLRQKDGNEGNEEDRMMGLVVRGGEKEKGRSLSPLYTPRT